MGYNTTVLILNDGLHDIETHPEEFFKNLNEKIMDGGDLPAGSHCNPAYVMPTGHADVFRLYATHQNSILELSKYSSQTMEYLRSDKDYLRRHALGMIEQAEWQLAGLKEAITEMAEGDSSG